MVVSGRSDSLINHRTTVVSRQRNSISGMVTNEVAVVSTGSSGPGKSVDSGIVVDSLEVKGPHVISPSGQQPSTVVYSATSAANGSETDVYMDNRRRSRS